MTKNYFNPEIFKGKLQEIKGDLQKKWGELTDDDLSKLKGNFNEYAGKISQKLGIQEEKFKSDINDILNKDKTSANTETKTTTTTYKRDNK